MDWKKQAQLFLNTKKKDKSTSIHAGNITIASGYKCQYCGVIRPFSRPNCFCEQSKRNQI